MKHWQGWPPDFWRKMGVREFYAYVEQARREQSQENGEPDSWQAAEQDEWWQKARRERDQAMGR